MESRAAGKALIISIVVTVLLYVIPYGHTVGYPLILFSTVAHELGHGLFAALSGGEFDRLVILPNAGGYAVTAHVAGDTFGRALSIAGGLIGPALLAAFLFVAARGARAARIAFLFMAAGLLLAEFLVVRNGFGLFFVAVLVVVFGLIGLKAPAEVNRVALVFLAVQLALTVFSRGDYLFAKGADLGAGQGGASDVQQLAETVGGTYWMWGVVCGAFSVAVLALGVWIFFFRFPSRGSASRQPALP